MTQKFELGQVVITKGIARHFERSNTFRVQATTSLLRYTEGDWGKISENDAALNEEALQIGDRLMACYETCVGDIWIITEWDRSVTTILLPEEY